jgi:hypothetical protein
MAKELVTDFVEIQKASLLGSMPVCYLDGMPGLPVSIKKFWISNKMAWNGNKQTYTIPSPY